MSQINPYIAASLKTFAAQCHTMIVDQIKITVQTVVPSTDVHRIGPWAAEGLDDIIIIPVQITYFGKKDGGSLVFHRLAKSGIYAYHEKLDENGNIFLGALTNEEEIATKARREAKLVARELSEVVDNGDIHINLYTQLYPSQEKKIFQITPLEVALFPPADDYSSILVNQRPSRPWL